ncbi:MAG: peptidoglycan DD-metalloendopeptidase family protein [Pseudomonadota bacterium]|nr:peptidoglycan DD-metalloendopeptidase family protein [Pseudomonadota bacterium]
MGLRQPLLANNLELKLEAEQKHLVRSQERQSKLARTSRKTSEELAVLKRRSILLVQSLNKRATMVAEIEAELIRLKTKMKLKKQNLHTAKKQLAMAIGALQKVTRMPTTIIFIVPRSPYEISRSLTLLRAITPQLKTQISVIQTKLQSLLTLRAKQKAEKKLVLSELTHMANHQQQLEIVVSEKLRMFRLVRAEEKNIGIKIAHISTRTSKLQELLGKLSKNTLTRRDTALKPSSQFIYSNENGTLWAPTPDRKPPLPVLGRVVQSFGTTLFNGAKSKGISIAASASAIVVAPRAGQIVFAGIFRGYGKLVIVELPNQGYALIGGIGKINAEVGDQVLVGEPLGKMPASTLSAPKLYFELRKNGNPVNPMPKTSAAKHRVPGQG